MSWDVWTEIISMVATTAFAVTAVLAIRGDRDIDPFGATVLGVITAVGGGTMRDIIVDVPVFWADNLTYVWVAVVASVVAFFGRRLFGSHHLYSVMLYLDGFGAAMFGIQGADKVWHLGFGLPVAPVILGIITAIGGGLLRDVLAGRTTLLLRPEMYAVPVMLGCSGFALILAYWPEQRVIGSIVCILGTFALRAAAIHWDLRVPWFVRAGAGRTDRAPDSDTVGRPQDTMTTGAD